MEMNINEYVWVKLTEAGEEAYNKHFKNLGIEPPPLKKTRDGWLKFQMWRLIQYFGSQCYLGGKGPFKGNILRFTPPQS